MDTLRIGILSILLSVSPNSLGKSAQLPFSLTISAPASVAPGSDVAIKITLTNSSETDIVIVDTDRECEYAVEIRAENGKPVSETQHKRDLKCKKIPFNGKRSIITLKPHKSMEDEMLIDRLYEMDRPGAYSIQLTREVPKEMGKGVVKSNILTIAVAE